MSFDVAYFQMKETLKNSFVDYWIRGEKGFSLVPKPQAKSQTNRWVHFLGYGVYGFHTINNTVDRIAGDYFHFILAKIKWCDSPTDEESKSMRGAYQTIHDIQDEVRGIKDKIRAKFYPRFYTLASRCLWIVVSILEALRGLPHSIYRFLTLSSIERSLTKQDIYRTVLQKFYHPHLIWQAKQGEIKLYFIPSASQQEFKFYKHDKLLGEISFYVKKVSDEEKPSLHILFYKVESEETKALFARYLNRLLPKLGKQFFPNEFIIKNKIKIFDESSFTPYPDGTIESQSQGSLLFYQQLLEDAKKGQFFIPIQDLVENLKYLRS